MNSIPLKIFKKQERESFIKLLKEQFGIEEIPYTIARLGKERIILFPEELSENEIYEVEKASRIEGIGLYFAKEMPDGIRLSIEGAQLMKNQITKNIFDLDEKQSEQWMLGQELNINIGKRGFIIMRYKNDFLGTGKASENKISNFIPKSRRLRYKEEKIE